MKYTIRTYPRFSACGLNCGLCPRYYTKGQSRCPGCAGEGFSEVHPPCGVLSCCQRKGIEYCFLCGEFPCEKYDGADAADSFITHQNQFRDLDKAKQIGMEAYAGELDEKIIILERLLDDYDDGRRKSFFCTAVNLIELPELRIIMEKLAAQATPDASRKAMSAAAVRLLEQMAEQKNVSLKLRKSANS